MEQLSPHYDVWEIVGEYEHYIPSIGCVIEDVLPSYDVSLQLHLPFSDINPASVIPEARRLAMRRIMDSIESASGLGITSMTLHPGQLSSISWRDRRWALETARSSIKEFYALASELGVRINLENMPYGKFMLGHSPEELSLLSEELDTGTWGICYDVGHGFISGYEDDFLASPGSITNLHVHDNDGGEDSHLIPGRGSIDFGKITRIVPSMNIAGVVFEARDIDDALKGAAQVRNLFE